MRTFHQFLLEMPMANYRYQLNDDPKQYGSGFDDTDKKLITNPKTFKDCERALAKSGYNFNILLIDFNRFQGDFNKHVEKYCWDNNIPIQGHITFAKNGSSGEAMTCWMILHTIGHALFAAVKPLKKQISKILEEIYVRHAQSYHGDSTSQEDMADFLSRFFKFASAIRRADKTGARKLAVRDMDEIIHELVAEYLWHGGNIRWQIPQGGESSDWWRYSNREVKTWNSKEFQTEIDKIKMIINQALQSQVGKIIYDLY